MKMLTTLSWSPSCTDPSVYKLYRNSPEWWSYNSFLPTSHHCSLWLPL